MDQSAWEEHLRAYRQSGLSAQAYAREHGLTYHQLLYRLRRESRQRKSSFVAITVDRSAAREGLLGVVALPNGVRIEVHDAALLPALSRWLVAPR